MKKISFFLLALCFLIILSACGNGTPDETIPSPETGQSVTIVNPVRPCTQEDAEAAAGFPMIPPENAVDTAHYIYHMGDTPMAEMHFTLKDAAYNYRICSDTEAEDISGMFYEWSNRRSLTLGDSEAEIVWNTDAPGCVLWFDKNSGTNFALSVTSGADPDMLTQLAKQLFLHQANFAEPDALEEEFTALLTDFRESYHPGSAGASLRSTAFIARLADFFTTYAPPADDVAATVESFIATLQDEEQNAFINLFQNAAEIFRSATGPDSELILSSCGYGSANELWNVDMLSRLFETMQRIVPEG